MVYICTPTFIGVCIILDMHMLTCLLILPYDLMFSKNFWFLQFYSLKTYSYRFDLYLFVFGRDRFFTVYICFKETLFFIQII